MAKVFLFRHQHAGIVTTHVFAKEPTDAQIAPIVLECERLHGREGWGAIHEAEFLTTEIPKFPDREKSQKTDNRADAGIATASGAGTVTPR